MTREEGIKIAITKIFPCAAEDRCYQHIVGASGFELGVEWADEHPKLSWINVEDDLPYNYEELIYEKDSRFTKSVLVRCVKITSGEELYKDAIMSKYRSENWFWATINDNYKVTHWMPIPKLSKA